MKVEIKDLMEELNSILEDMWDRSLDRKRVNEFVDAIGEISDKVVEIINENKEI